MVEMYRIPNLIDCFDPIRSVTTCSVRTSGTFERQPPQFPRLHAESAIFSIELDQAHRSSVTNRAFPDVIAWYPYLRTKIPLVYISALG